jgi:hypothetical protein
MTLRKSFVGEPPEELPYSIQRTIQSVNTMKRRKGEGEGLRSSLESEESSWSLRRMWNLRALDAARPAMGEVAKAADTRGDYDRESKT